MLGKVGESYVGDGEGREKQSGLVRKMIRLIEEGIIQLKVVQRDQSLRVSYDCF